MTIRSKTELTNTINARIPDNNAGLISAGDVRNSMIDIVDSINQIVASGNFNATNPFVNDVRLRKTAEQGGILHVESGINFVNGGGMQYSAYPGSTGVNHNTLANLDQDDPHTQYLPINGSRRMLGSLGTSTFWINSSGQADVTSDNGYRGLQFSKLTNTSETINVGSGTSFVFLRDRSNLNSARGVAKAWINFDASGVTHLPVVRDSYNVSGIQRLDKGKFKIIFHSGVFANNNYVAIASSNSTTASGSPEDFVNNTVGIVMREGNDATTLRSLTFVIRDEGGEYVNAKINDLVVYGTEPNGSGSPPVTIIP